MQRTDLLQRFPRLKPILKSRVFQPALMLVTLFVFTLAILTGLFGTPADSRNFRIIAKQTVKPPTVFKD